MARKSNTSASSAPGAVYTTTEAFADALGVSRQSLAAWRKAAWWPVNADAPWDETDLLAVQEARELLDGGASNPNLHDEFKRSQTLRNRAATFRIMRESEKELGHLADVEPVRQVFKTVLTGAAGMLAIQTVRHNVTDWVQSRCKAQFGVALHPVDRIRIEDELRSVVGNPIAIAIHEAVEQFIETGWGDNITFGLIRELKQLAADMGERIEVEEPEARDEIDRLINKLRSAVGDGKTLDDKLAESNINLAHAAIDADPLLATAVADMVAADEYRKFAKKMERAK